MSFTLDLIEKLLRTSGEAYRLLTLRLGDLITDPEIPELTAEPFREILRWDPVVADVLNQINPKTSKDFISLHQKRWKQLLSGEKLNSVQDIKDFISILDQKRHILRMALVRYENSPSNNPVASELDIELTKIHQKLPLYLKPNVGICTRDGSTILQIKGNRMFIFLEGCIKLCGPDFKVSENKLREYLISQYHRMPQRENSNLLDVKKVDNREFIRQAYYDLQKRGIPGLESFLVLDSSVDGGLKWKIEQEI